MSITAAPSSPPPRASADSVSAPSTHSKRDENPDPAVFPPEGESGVALIRPPSLPESDEPAWPADEWWFGDAPVARPQRRRVRVRARAVRARTISVNRPRFDLPQPRRLELLVEVRRPETRAECKDGIRPCPFVSCRHHLYLDVHPRTGGLKINFPDLEPWQLRETCALDVADNGNTPRRIVGELMNVTSERVRQVEHRVLAGLRRLTDDDGDEDASEVPAGVRATDDDGGPAEPEGADDSVHPDDVPSAWDP